MSSAVVAVTYHPDAQTLEAFLESVAACGSSGPVVLADNSEPGEQDVVVAAAAARYGAQLCSTGGNLGYGGGANAGVRSVESEFVLIANPDVVLGAGVVKELVEAAQRWPTGGAFGPCIRTPAGEVYPSARALPSLGRGIGHALAGWWWPANPWTKAYRNERGELGECAVGWLSGACLLVRRRAFEQIGGFDTSYFMYFEDVDLGRRLGLAGWQSIYVPGAEVMHVGAHATERQPAAMATEHHRGAWRYLRRQYSAWYQAPLRGVLWGGLHLRAALARRSQRVAAGARPNNQW